jgi:D-3-phosphoglycerate dehydrogenase
MERREDRLIVLNAEHFGYSKKAIKYWNSAGYTYKYFDWEKIDGIGDFNCVQVLIVRLSKFISSRELNNFPNLKAIISATTGTDHLDIDEIHRRDIKIYCLKDHISFLETIPSTAEHTWALLLSLVRNIPRSCSKLKKGVWDRDNNRGIQLFGRTLGIIGLGRTGRKVANYAVSFGMNVIFFDPYVFSDSIGQKVDNLRRIFELSDVVSLHLHLNEKTIGMINANVLQHAMKRPFIINTSRGRIINEHDLVNALISDQIAGIATDVLSTELDDFSESPLYKKMLQGFNIIITPHLGGATWDAMHMCEEYISNYFIEQNT